MKPFTIEIQTVKLTDRVGAPTNRTARLVFYLRRKFMTYDTWLSIALALALAAGITLSEQAARDGILISDRSATRDGIVMGDRSAATTTAAAAPRDGIVMGD